MKSKSTLILIMLLFCFFGSKKAFSQIKVGNNCTSINSGSLMEFETTNKGILLPRVALSDTATWTLTGSSADGMFVYNTATVSGKFQPGIYFWKTNKWHLVVDGVGTNTYWGTQGNAGTLWSRNFLGTTDNTSLRIKTNNTARMIIDSSGNVGIGLTAARAKLHIDGGNATASALKFTTGTTTGATATDGLEIGVTTTGAGEIRQRENLALSFLTNNTNRLNITAAGNFGIGNVTPSSTQKLYVSNDYSGYDSSMVLTAAGNLGIGLSSPYALLNIRRATAAAPATSGTTSTAIARFDAQNNALDMGAYTASPYGSWIQATTVADLATNLPLALNPNGGYIGIGTASPANRLEIVNNGGSGADDDFGIKSYGASTTPQIFMQSAGGTASVPTNLSNGADLGSIACWGQVSGSGTMLNKISNTFTGTGTRAKSTMSFTTSGVEHMRIDSMGRTMIGINTASFAPLTSLHMYGDGTSGFAPTGTTSQPSVGPGPEIGFARGGYYSGVGASIQFLDYNSYSGGLAFNVHKGTQNNAGGAFLDNWPTDVIQAMTIVNNGQVGIGTSDPTAIFHTVASGAKTAAYSGNLLTNTATSSTASINKAGLEVTSTGTWNGASAKNIGLYVSSVTGGTNNYDAIFNGGGNVGIGNIAPAAKLDVTGSIASSGGITTNSGGSTGIGYTTGAGGTVVQSTSKSTAVTLSKNCGTITMNAAALNSGSIVSFTVTNTNVTANDIVYTQHDSGGTLGAYTVTANTMAAGSYKITVRNNTAGNLSEAIVIRFVVIKAVNN